MKKLITTISLLTVALIANASTLAEISKDVTFKNSKDKYAQIVADNQNVEIIESAYADVVSGEIDMTKLPNSQKALLIKYIEYSGKEITSENAFIFAGYSPFRFAKSASEEIFFAELSKATGAEKKVMLQVLRNYNVWEIDSKQVNNSVAKNYVLALVRNQGTKTNEEMLKKMVELSTLFGAKNFTAGATEASKQMAIYYAAIKALQSIK